MGDGPKREKNSRLQVPPIWVMLKLVTFSNSFPDAILEDPCSAKTLSRHRTRKRYWIFADHDLLREAKSFAALG
jgi:hypothetical protein